MATAMNTQNSPMVMRWPASLYHQMAELGWFRDKRVELVRGEIIIMSPMGSRHWVAVGLVADALRHIYPNDKFVVAEQRPVSLSDESEPEPDVALIKGQIRDFTSHLPAACELVVEVSDSSLAFDRSIKAALYAEAGIPEYWIVDVNGMTVEVLANPVDDGSSTRYQYRKTLGEEELLVPLSAPGASIKVGDILP
jgi:Uma2 family endonuclease